MEELCTEIRDQIGSLHWIERGRTFLLVTVMQRGDLNLEPFRGGRAGHGILPNVARC